MDIINLAFCEVMLEGDADGNISASQFRPTILPRALTGTVKFPEPFSK
jgi:hypothetical protein